jgi:hypothetical protein
MPNLNPHTPLLALLSLTLLGCGAQPSPVAGRVKFKDGGDISVLAGYEVAFDSDAKSAGAAGHITADGTFKLTTFSPDDGALPGAYHISISPPLTPDSPPAKAHIPTKYSDSSTSGLTAHIKPDHENPILLELDHLP